LRTPVKNRGAENRHPKNTVTTCPEKTESYRSSTREREENPSLEKKLAMLDEVIGGDHCIGKRTCCKKTETA